MAEADELFSAIVARYFMLWPLHQPRRFLREDGYEGEKHDDRTTQIEEVHLFQISLYSVF